MAQCPSGLHCGRAGSTLQLQLLTLLARRWALEMAALLLCCTIALAAQLSLAVGASVVARDLAELRSANTASGSAILLGHSLAGDGGGGVFAFDAASTAGDDGGCVVAPTGTATGRWIRDLAGGAARPEFFCGRIANVSTVDASPCFQQALECAGWVQAGHGEYTFQSTLVVGTGHRVSGVGPDSTNLTLAPGANTDLIRSQNFQDLHDRGVWFVDAGMITGIEIRDVALFGNADVLGNAEDHAELASPLPADAPRAFRARLSGRHPEGMPSPKVAASVTGTGIRLHAKRYIVSNVLIFQFAGQCFYSEAGDHTGQNQAQDMPEASIGPLWVRDCGAGNFEYQGPHDGNIKRVFSAGGTGNGITIAAVPGLTGGECDIDFIHVYAAGGFGVVTNTSVQAQYLITESNRGGGWLMLGHTIVGILKAFSNQEPSAERAALAHPSVLQTLLDAPLPPAAIIDIQADKTTISAAFIAHSTNGTAVRIAGTQTQLGNAYLASSSQYAATAVRLEANQVRLQAVVEDFVGGDGCVVLGHPANQPSMTAGVSMSRIEVAASGCETAVLNYSLAGANNDVQIASYVSQAVPSTQWVGVDAQPSDRIRLVTRGTRGPANSSWTMPEASTRWRGTVSVNTSSLGSHSLSMPHGLVRSPRPAQCTAALSGQCFASGCVVAGPWITGTASSTLELAWFVMEPCTGDVQLDVSCDIGSAVNDLDLSV